VLVQPVPQVLHHALPHDGREVRLQHADHRCEERDGDHQPNQQVQEVKVRPASAAREERSIEDDLRQERVDDAES
jgi:hypothetical protein